MVVYKTDINQTKIGLLTWEHAFVSWTQSDYSLRLPISTETKKILKNLVIGIHEENGVISLVTEQGTISS